MNKISQFVEHLMVQTCLLTSTSLVCLVAINGCMTEQSSSVTPASTNALTGVVTGPVTNTVTIINTNNLILDCAVIKAAATVAAKAVIANAPSLVPDFKLGVTALGDVYNGVGTNTLTQVLSSFNVPVSGSVAVTSVQQFGDFLPVVEVARAALITKLGTKNAGIIDIYISQALFQGFTAGGL